MRQSPIPSEPPLRQPSDHPDRASLQAQMSTVDRHQCHTRFDHQSGTATFPKTHPSAFMTSLGTRKARVGDADASRYPIDHPDAMSEDTVLRTLRSRRDRVPSRTVFSKAPPLLPRLRGPPWSPRCANPCPSGYSATTGSGTPAQEGWRRNPDVALPDTAYLDHLVGASTRSRPLGTTFKELPSQTPTPSSGSPLRARPTIESTSDQIRHSPDPRPEGSNTGPLSGALLVTDRITRQPFATFCASRRAPELRLLTGLHPVVASAAARQSKNLAIQPVAASIKDRAYVADRSQFAGL